MAGLFGYRPAPKVVKATTAPGARTSVSTSGLAYLGSVTMENGKPSWMFKDIPLNAVLALELGKESGGWKLLEVRTREFLLESGGKLYSVTF